MTATLVRRAIDARTTADLLATIEAHPAWQLRGGDGFDPYCSSIELAALPGIDIAGLATGLLDGEAGHRCRTALGDALALDVDRCWIRRQYAPCHAPVGHWPHAWHQDGALGFDFLDGALDPGAALPLRMLTCWIALTACGDDAPGLELRRHPFETLLGLAELRDGGAGLRPGDEARWAPSMRPGDALLFGGGVLHRTHVEPAMGSDRTSLELRLFDAARIPPQLRDDRFIPVH